MMAKAIDVALKSVHLPLRYTSAVEAKQSAEEDIALARNQRQQQTTQAGTKLATAQTGAQVIDWPPPPPLALVSETAWCSWRCTAWVVSPAGGGVVSRERGGPPTETGRHPCESTQLRPTWTVKPFMCESHGLEQGARTERRTCNTLSPLP